MRESTHLLAGPAHAWLIVHSSLQDNRVAGHVVHISWIVLRGG